MTQLGREELRPYLRDERPPDDSIVVVRGGPDTLIEPGAIVVAGDEDAPAVAEVVDIVDKPAGRVVHLHILPGLLKDYQAVIQRAVIPA